jgi:hypothetical protein
MMPYPNAMLGDEDEYSDERADPVREELSMVERRLRWCGLGRELFSGQEARGRFVVGVNGRKMKRSKMVKSSRCERIQDKRIKRWPRINLERMESD